MTTDAKTYLLAHHFYPLNLIRMHVIIVMKINSYQRTKSAVRLEGGPRCLRN